ncbi:MAG: transposase [Desulfobacteraceae bacterium]|nr:transposase [Desulfobacteraceae bacterium]
MGATINRRTAFNRKPEFHPHIHAFVPGGGIDKKIRQWKKNKGRYLFNEKSMTKVFRAHLLMN